MGGDDYPVDGIKCKSEIIDPGSDFIRVTPIGAGQEVGRSCIIVEYKSKKIMLDCGIHPGYNGLSSLPFFDEINPSDIDIIFVTHFHLDHCGALPWFLSRTHFKGRVFMTHATKAIYKWLLSDFIKISGSNFSETLFSEKELLNTLDRIEPIHFHQQKECGGVRFTCYHAGHVLGAAMFLFDIAGIKILYTGDFSRHEDRHLMAAEIPPVKPDILIMESTYGIYIHEKRELREQRYTSAIKDIVLRGGRCLIPAFALGRAQEQLLILDQFWEENKQELAEIPIYYASSLAKKCMAVYQTYTSSMNEKMQNQIAIHNPFKFKYISYVKTISEFDDHGPCVVLASPGMLQNGFSRDLFERWCSDSKNGVILAGYAVEGTLAKELMSEPTQVTSLLGRPLIRKCSIDYISFSAHADYTQLKEMVEGLLPKSIVLVHGEANEMKRLRTSLLRDLSAQYPNDVEIYTPRNTCFVQLRMKGEMTAKIYGKELFDHANNNKPISGIVFKKGFNYKIVSLSDLQKYTRLSSSGVVQHLRIPFPDDDNSRSILLNNLSQLTGSFLDTKFDPYVYFNQIKISSEPNTLVLEWESDKSNDITADTIVAVISETARQISVGHVNYFTPNHNPEITEIFEKVYGSNNVIKIDENKIHIIIGDSMKAIVNVSDHKVECENEVVKIRLEKTLTHYKKSIEPFCKCK